MRRCIQCTNETVDDRWRCLACGFEPLKEGGFTAFASAVADGGFDDATFAWLADIEPGFWWFEARNDLITWALRKWCSNAKSLLEIGCGTGFVAAAIAERFPGLRVSVGELFPAGLAIAAKRVPNAEIYQMDARNIPFSGEFDVIAAFDVLEHIKKDEIVLAEMRRAVSASGIAMITVPQHPFLWSRSDTFGHHQRRYTRCDLERKLLAANFSILAIRSFVSLLLPLQLLARYSPAPPVFDPRREFTIPHGLNRILRSVMSIEVAMIQSGMSFPFGGSLLAIAQAN